MDRDRPSFLERSRLVLEPILDDLGFRLVAEHYHQFALRSACVVYSGPRGREVRLIWDGTEGDLLLERRDGEEFRSLEFAGDESDARIESLAAAIRLAVQEW